MTLPEAILWLVVLFVGVPSAWRNPTAAALVLCWVFSQGLYAITGNGLAVEFYTYPDIFVLTVILCKPEHCNVGLYDGVWHQLKCILIERSPADRFIMLSYPVCWWLYIADIHPFYQWWGLWSIAVAQFLAAGVESFIKVFRRAEAVSDTPGPPSGDVYRRLAWSRGYV